jgi:hypothetical protein
MLSIDDIFPAVSAVAPILTGIGVVLYRLAHIVETVESISGDFKAHSVAHVAERSDTVDRLARIETQLDLCPYHARGGHAD